tara:strand:- start:6624 stop:7160 length:537 start_codon:yes stop_codon:yes gene_type:complete
MVHTGVLVSDNGMQDYLDAFCPGWRAGESQHVRGRVLVKGAEFWTSPSTNLHHVLCHLSKLPFMQITVEARRAEDIAYIEDLSCLVQNMVNWSSAMDKDCLALYYREPQGIPEFALRLGPNFQADWFDPDNGTNEQGAIAFLKDLGFFSRGAESLPVWVSIELKARRKYVLCRRLHGG